MFISRGHASYARAAQSNDNKPEERPRGVMGSEVKRRPARDTEHQDLTNVC